MEINKIGCIFADVRTFICNHKPAPFPYLEIRQSTSGASVPQVILGPSPSVQRNRESRRRNLRCLILAREKRGFQSLDRALGGASERIVARFVRAFCVRRSGQSASGTPILPRMVRCSAGYLSDCTSASKSRISIAYLHIIDW